MLGKFPLNLISGELELNVTIEQEILPCYQRQAHLSKHMFKLSLVEPREHHSFLDLKGKPARLMKAAFKFIQKNDIRMVDFSNIGFHDDCIQMLAGYLSCNPNLRSVKLDNNLFTDAGIRSLTEKLRFNTRLVHLSIKGCEGVTDEGLRELYDIITSINTVLFQIDLDVNQFDAELAKNTVIESRLNRDIQEKLKPKKILSRYNPNYASLLKEQEFSDENLQASAR